MRLHSIGISNYDSSEMPRHTSLSDKWNYDKFYEAAREIGAGEVDIFLMEGEVEVVPCGNELFKYKGIR